MAATTLLDAAQQSYAVALACTLSNTIRARLLAFAATVLPFFPEEGANNHPIANWATIIGQYATNLNATTALDFEARLAGDYLYRICLMGNELDNQTLITTAQATALLSAWNASLGVNAWSSGFSLGFGA